MNKSILYKYIWNFYNTILLIFDCFKKGIPTFVQGALFWAKTLLVATIDSSLVAMVLVLVLPNGIMVD